ncbi:MULTISPECIES: DUF3445 domain-containing protein [unclassified Pseudofrankia]|uniref:heme-dependent oxidative N-demethylase family protein n=1 Tax=unclassified Pseudofrankia TaxID=2994372 RepID=UPI0008DAE607|nr:MULTISPECIES: DUF3445 domain-containing protein [unclassified Pseudofrankia]MDT3444427.1 DUF3445 domain-containing protein [Pseudofrankia sp. BMG5.37]OHV56449.1 hypothetical protein BCD48_08235 [Pseudofrankia sp. BMG5.36]
MSAPESSSLLRGFPFPFTDERFRYSTNVEPAGVPVHTAAGRWGAAVVDIDGEYHRELQERARILAQDPTRHAVPTHMRTAAWDATLTLLRELAASYPADMLLTRTGINRWRWENRRLGVEADFVYGDDATLPGGPLHWVANQVQEDIVLLDARAGQLWVDAGVVTFASAWSFGFDLGMSFLEIHGPVPRIHSEGVITRAQEFIRRLQPHQPYRRTNWGVNVGRRLDVSLERYPDWAPDRARMRRADDGSFGRLLHLRVEVQHLVRLPDSGAVMFLIRTYLLSFEQLATVEPWRRRTADVLAHLPDDIAEYKGVANLRDRAVAWLRAADAPPAGPAPH